MYYLRFLGKAHLIFSGSSITVDGRKRPHAEVVAHWTTTNTSALRQRYWMADFPFSRELMAAGMALIDDLKTISS